MRVIEVQPTPNPNAMKFMLDAAISQQPISCLNAQAAQSNEVARRLFEVNGVTSVLMLGDFVTVNKEPNANWTEIKRGVKKVLNTAGVEDI